jgi:hypothetical protein
MTQNKITISKSVVPKVLDFTIMVRTRFFLIFIDSGYHFQTFFSTKIAEKTMMKLEELPFLSSSFFFILCEGGGMPLAESILDRF